jgi:hypothetical protein
VPNWYCGQIAGKLLSGMNSIEKFVKTDENTADEKQQADDK